MKTGILRGMIAIFLFTLLATIDGQAQLLKKVKKKIEDKANRRVDRKIDQTIDKGLDKAEKNGKSISTKKKGSTNKEAGENQEQNQEPTASASSFKVNTRFDFVAGDKVIAVDDFSRVNLGDFPTQWYTNGSGEVVNIDGQSDKWLELKGNFTYYPEFIKTLPDNFTLEYDLVFNYSTAYLVKNIIGFYIIAADAKTQNDPAFKYGFNEPGIQGAAIEFESYKPNRLNIYNWKNKKVDLNSKTTSEAGYIGQMKNTKVHISVWRQKERVRMYLNDKKIVDAPRLLGTGAKYNMIKFAFEDWKSDGRAYIANIRFAQSAPDMRSKLITEGKFVTSGIYFNSNSDKIKPESYGILKEMAAILSSSAGVKIKIVGHTDSDGAPENNLSLSKKRAESVKNALVKDYGIDAGRIETDGKGESSPLSPNDTDAGKANNRRVEFIKI